MEDAESITGFGVQLCYVVSPGEVMADDESQQVQETKPLPVADHGNGGVHSGMTFRIRMHSGSFRNDRVRQ